MAQKNKGLLQNPQGTEGIYLEEAFRHRQIVRAVNDLFTAWGYLPAQVPMYDFFDTYRDLIDNRTAETIYRLTDRDGDLLMLRSDVTLFLAKQVGSVLQKQDLPLRICYADSILRHQDREDISRNEFFQVGAELIGDTGIRGDLEVLSLLAKLLSVLDLPECYIHIGSRRLFDLITDRVKPPEKERIGSLIATRDSAELKKALSDLQIAGDPSGDPDFFADLFLFIGNAREFKTVTSDVRVESDIPGMKEALDDTLSIFQVLKGMYPAQKLRIDLSEIGAQSYYTGPVFQVYAEGSDRAVASGGRYDDLLAHFGPPCPSIGFSMLLRKVEPLMKKTKTYSFPAADHINTENFRDALEQAEKIRENGGIAIL